MNTRRHFLSSLLLSTLAPAIAADDGFVSLFDGKTLTGWKNAYDWGLIEVVNGEIHLTGEKKFFVVTEKTYGDFIFEGDILLPTGERINAETVKNALSVLRASDEPEDSPGMRL